MNYWRLKVPVNDEDHFRGSLNAPVVLVEYGDFESHYCAKAFLEVEKLIEELSEHLCFVYRYFPLENLHPHALIAATAAEAANQQGSFWRMYHLLFNNHLDLSVNNILLFAQSLGLDMKKFEEDMGRKQFSTLVHQHFMGGVRSGVNGMPTFYINGCRFELPASFDNLVQMARQLMRESSVETSSIRLPPEKD